LAQAKACYKLGEIKKSLSLVKSSLLVSNSTEAEEFLKEVERMAYFESLIEYSKTNPLYPQIEDEYSNNQVGTNLVNSSIKSIIKLPKFVSQKKYVYSQEKELSWQLKFINHTKSIL
jgi:hypothetical protein